jgi:hypothetical protein
VKQVGSVMAVSMAAATRALGRGYLMVPSVGCFGLEMWFLERVTMGGFGRGGLGISVEGIGDGDAVSEFEDMEEEVLMGWACFELGLSWAVG